jgi:transposase
VSEEVARVDQVVIGVDPHKLSVTIEARDRREILRAKGRFGTDTGGCRQLLAYARQWPDRVWAVEGANGVGRPLAQRLLASGERVLDVPAKLAARARVFATGQGRKTDPADAHAIVMVALRDKRLRELTADPDCAVLRLLCDRRDELSRARAQALNRLHRLFTELIPGGAPVKKSAAQYRQLLARVRPRDPAGQMRRRMAAEELADIEYLDTKLTAMKAELKAAVAATGSHLMDIHGIGPAGAARILADVGGIARFPNRAHFASRPAPPRSMPPPASTPTTGCPALVTGGSTTCSTWPASSPPQRHPRPRLLPAPRRRREDLDGGDALPAAAAVRRDLPPAGRRRPCAAGGPGRAPRGVCVIQRGRPSPGHRHFGSATSRARSHDATPATSTPGNPRGPDRRHLPPARRRCQRGAPHRTNDVDTDPRWRTLENAWAAPLTSTPHRREP